MNNIGKLLIALFLLGTCAVCQAAPTAELTVTPSSGTLQDSYIMRVTVKNGSEVKYPELEGGEDFDILLLGPEQQVKITNGVVEQSYSYVYQLRPKRSGKLTSPGGSIEVEGQVLHVAPTEILVTETPAPDTNVKASGDVFLRQYTTSNRAYLGQQIFYVLQVFQRITVHNPQLLNPTIQGMWQEDLGDETKSRAIMDGAQYEVTTLNKALFPLETGRFKLPPVELSGQVPVRGRRNNRFDDFFGAPFDLNDFFGNLQLEQRTFKAEQPEIEVIPLPPTPADLPRWGQSQVIVGQTSVFLSYDPTAISVGDSKTFELTVESQGNLKPLVNLPIAETPELRFYQDAPKSLFRVENGKAIFTKTFRFTLVPTSGGNIDLPPIALGYFDTEQSKFVTTQTEPIKFFVNGPVTKSTPALSTQNTKNSELRYEEPGLWTKLSGWLSLSTLLLLALITTIAFCLIFVWRRNGACRLESELVKREILESTSLEALVIAFKRALAKTDLASSEVESFEALKARVRASLWSPDLKASGLWILDALERALYGGSETQSSELESLRTKVLTLIRSLDLLIKKR